MQKDYKNAMEKIFLTDSDKERILMNVKKAYEETPDRVIAMDDFGHKRPRFSARRMGAAAAAAAIVLLLVGTWMLRSSLFPGQNKENPTGDIIAADSGEEIWEELASVDAIAKETDCRTYTLSNVSKGYKVKKVEVAKKQKHVKITYRNKKQKDRILLEYKEEENAPAVIGQFEEEKELAKETVGDSEVTMYGDGKCDGMTWQQESCTFAVKMSRACSTEKAKTLVSGTKEKTEKVSSRKRGKGEDARKISKSAVGWSGSEKESSDRERRKVLKKIYELYGFRVMIEDPAKKVAYKIVDDFESFSFRLDEYEELKKQRIVGYAGPKGCPPGMLKGYEEEDVYSVNGIQVYGFQNKKDEWLFYFVKQDVHFTLLIHEWEGEETGQMLSGMLSVIHISLDEGSADSDENDSSDDPDDEADEDPDEEDDIVAAYQETVQNIQYAVAEGSMKKLSSYMKFPLTIKGLDITVNSAKEFQGIDPSLIFTSAWVDAVVAYDGSRIRSNTKSIHMGDETHSLSCRIINSTVVVTELCVSRTEIPATPEPTVMPPEE